MNKITFGKWEKNGMQRIYFNSPFMGGTKVYAHAGKDGNFTVGSKASEGEYGNNRSMGDIENAAVKALEKLLGKPIMHETKFADVWALV